MEKVKLGIIGIGNMGSAHVRSLLEGKVPDIVLTAVADIKASRREWAKATLPDVIEIFDNGDALIESKICEAVLIAVPHYDHPHLAIKAFEHGLHVLCEKPAGVYTKQVREMNEAAEKSNLVFAMMFNQRTSHLYRKVHELVQSGEYGAIKRVNWIITDWYRTQAYYNSGGWRGTWSGEGGGVLTNQCPHNLDLLQWICGMPSKVQAFCHVGKWHDIEVEDDVTAYMEFPNGATGVFVTSTGDAPGTNRLEITLEKGKLLCENNTLRFYVLDENERDYCFHSSEGFKPLGGHWITPPTDGENLQHIGVLRSFAANILRHEPLIAKGEEGINSVMLCNAMYLSSWLGKMVELPIDENLYLEKLSDLRSNSHYKKEVREIVFNTENTYGSGEIS